MILDCPSAKIDHLAYLIINGGDVTQGYLGTLRCGLTDVLTGAIPWEEYCEQHDFIISEIIDKIIMRRINSINIGPYITVLYRYYFNENYYKYIERLCQVLHEYIVQRMPHDIFVKRLQEEVESLKGQHGTTKAYGIRARDGGDRRRFAKIVDADEILLPGERRSRKFRAPKGTTLRLELYAGPADATHIDNCEKLMECETRDLLPEAQGQIVRITIERAGLTDLRLSLTVITEMDVDDDDD